jgi:uncharacterized paraquat-inducible protein A
MSIQNREPSALEIATHGYKYPDQDSDGHDNNTVNKEFKTCSECGCSFPVSESSISDSTLCPNCQ